MRKRKRKRHSPRDFYEKQLSCLGRFGGCPKMADSVGVRQHELKSAENIRNSWFCVKSVVRVSFVDNLQTVNEENALG